MNRSENFEDIVVKDLTLKINELNEKYNYNTDLFEKKIFEIINQKYDNLKINREKLIAFVRQTDNLFWNCGLDVYNSRYELYFADQYKFLSSYFCYDQVTESQTLYDIANGIYCRKYKGYVLKYIMDRVDIEDANKFNGDCFQRDDSCLRNQIAEHMEKNLTEEYIKEIDNVYAEYMKKIILDKNLEMINDNHERYLKSKSTRLSKDDLERIRVKNEEECYARYQKYKKYLSF